MIINETELIATIRSIPDFPKEGILFRDITTLLKNADAYETLVESIADLAKDKKIEGISDIDDHSSDRVGIRVEISVKRDANPQVVLNKLFKFTRLQDSFSINMLAIDNGKPRTMGLKDILSNFIFFQEEIVTRRTEFDLKKAQERAHILEGLKIDIDFIDEVIAIIRKSNDICSK